LAGSGAVGPIVRVSTSGGNGRTCTSLPNGSSPTERNWRRRPLGAVDTEGWSAADALAARLLAAATRKTTSGKELASHFGKVPDHVLSPKMVFRAVSQGTRPFNGDEQMSRLRKCDPSGIQ